MMVTPPKVLGADTPVLPLAWIVQDSRLFLRWTSMHCPTNQPMGIHMNRHKLLPPSLPLLVPNKHKHIRRAAFPTIPKLLRIHQAHAMKVPGIINVKVSYHGWVHKVCMSLQLLPIP